MIILDHEMSKQNLTSIETISFGEDIVEDYSVNKNATQVNFYISKIF